MKKLIFSLMALVAVMVSSCKSNEDPTPDFTEEIQKIVPKAILKDVKAKGMNINEGKVPPSLKGTFVIDPMELLSPYNEDDPWEKGKIIEPYYVRFRDYDADNNTVLLDYNNQGSDEGKGLGAYVAGSGRKFTIFAEAKGVASGVSYTTLLVISGELTEDGEIKNYQMATYLKEKSETEDILLIPVNQGRIWFDNDRLSKKTSTYNGRVAATTQPASIKTLLSTKK
ncbi:hypothetical protein [Emticicia fontis]